LHIDPLSVEKIEIEWADVLIIETGVNVKVQNDQGETKWLADASEEYLNQLAQGSGNPDGVRDSISSAMDAYNKALVRRIYGSGKRVYVEHSPIHTVEYEPQLRINIADSSQWFDDVLRQFEARLVKLHEENLKRDNAFAQLVAEKVQQHPGKNILVLRGSAHRHTLLEQLNRKGIKYDIRLGDIEPFKDDVMKKIASGQSPTRTDIMRALAVQFETTKLQSHLPFDHQQLQTFCAKLKHISKEDLRTLLKEEIRKHTVSILDYSVRNVM